MQRHVHKHGNRRESGEEKTIKARTRQVQKKKNIRERDTQARAHTLTKSD